MKRKNKWILTFLISIVLNQIENLVLLTLFGLKITVGNFFGSLIFSVILTVILKFVKVI